MKPSKLLPLIGLAIFAFIISRMDLHAVYENFKSISLWLLAASFLAVIPSLLLKAYKWKLLMRPMGIDYSMRDSVRAWLVGFFISLLTPAKVGDFSRALYVKKEKNVSLGIALTSVIMDRVLDIMLLFLLALIGVVGLATQYTVPSGFGYLVLGSFVLVVIGTAAATRKSFIQRMFRPLFNVFVPEKYKETLSKSFHEFYAGLHELLKERRLLVWTGFLTLLSWLSVFVQYYLAALALGLPVTYWFLVLILPVTLLVEILPISFSGLGTRDATLIFLLGIISITSSAAVSFSILLLVMNYAVAMLGVGFWLRYPLKI